MRLAMKALMLALIAISLAPAIAMAQTYSTPVAVANAGELPTESQPTEILKTTDGTYWIVEYNASWLYLYNSTNAGASWNYVTRLSQVAIANPKAYYITSNSTDGILVAYGHAGNTARFISYDTRTATLGTDIRMSSNYNRVNIAVNGTDAIFYMSYNEAGDNILFNRSTDGGKTWTSSTSFGAPSTYYINFNLYIDYWNNIHLTGSNKTTYYSLDYWNSTAADAGTSWTWTRIGDLYSTDNGLTVGMLVDFNQNKHFFFNSQPQGVEPNFFQHLNYINISNSTNAQSSMINITNNQTWEGLDTDTPYPIQVPNGSIYVFAFSSRVSVTLNYINQSYYLSASPPLMTWSEPVNFANASRYPQPMGSIWPAANRVTSNSLVPLTFKSTTPSSYPIYFMNITFADAGASGDTINISIVHPLNSTNTSSNYSLIYYLASTNTTDRCWWINSTGGNNSLPSCNNITFLEGADGLKTIQVCANLTSGTANCTSRSFTRLTASQLTINYVKPNGTYYVLADIKENFTITPIGGATVGHCWWTVNGIYGGGFASCTNATLQAETYTLSSPNMTSSGTYAIRLYANDSTYGIESNEEENITIVLDFINVTGRDESTYALLENLSAIFSNATAANSTGTFNYTKAVLIDQIPYGSLIITASYNSVSRFYTMVNDNTTQNLTIYFPSALTSAYYSLQTVIQTTTTAVPNATITVYRYITATRTFEVMSRGTTGIDGIFSFYAEPNVQYLITVSAASYQSRSFMQIFSTNSVITIELTPSGGGSFGDVDIFGDYYNANFTFNITPSTPYVRLGTTINTTLWDNLSLTTWTTINVTWLNYSNMTNISLRNPYDFRNTTSSSFVLGIPLNFTGIYYYNVTIYRNGSYESDTRIYVASNFTGIFDAAAISESGGPSILFFKILFLVLVTFVAAATYRFIGAAILFEIPIFVMTGVMWNIFTIPEAIIIIGVSLPVFMKLFR